MVKKTLTTLFILGTILSLQAQIPEDFLRVDISDQEGAKLLSERTFTKESLFGYMNGGAELYLEYGFDRLVVTELTLEGKDLKVEIYRMPSPEMSFGIYSVNIFKCAESDPLGKYYCQSDYQVQFHKGDYYVNIINNSGSSAGLVGARTIARNLIDNIEKDEFEIRSYISEDDIPKDITKVMYIAGDLALDNYAFEFSDYLEAYPEYNLVVVEHGKGTMLIIILADSDNKILHIDEE